VVDVVVVVELPGTVEVVVVVELPGIVEVVLVLVPGMGEVVLVLVLPGIVEVVLVLDELAVSSAWSVSVADSATAAAPVASTNTANVAAVKPFPMLRRIDVMRTSRGIGAIPHDLTVSAKRTSGPD
jgi:hypothetical protein